MWGVATELPPVGARRTIANLPEFELEDLLPVCEMLCQEGFTTWALPPDRIAEIAELRQLFSRRARVGVAGVTTPAQVKAAAESGAAFAASITHQPRLVKALPGFPVILGGLTPTELKAGLDAGAAAVQVMPADAFDADYARRLPALLGYPPLIASGWLRRSLAAVWLECGVVGVWPDRLFEDAFAVGPSLDRLRAELNLWRLDE